MNFTKEPGGIVFVIPSLKPSQLLINLLGAIENYMAENTAAVPCAGIVIVNDGSPAEYDPFYEQAKDRFGCEVLRHVVNLGKGRALKTAFNYYMDRYPDAAGIVTLDSDGQHAVEDIYKCAAKLIDYPRDLVLGCRDFDQENVPSKSRMGNKITRKVFHFLCGVNVSDTQTGLRGIPNSYIAALMNVSGERFEYEMNMLLACKNNSVHIQEVKIATIYIDENQSSHFNPLLDSLRVYSIFLRYIFAGVSSSLCDILAFSAFIALFDGIIPQYYIFVSTVCARAISSIYNYFFNRKVVFRSKDTLSSSLVKYYCLVVIQMCISGLLVTKLHDLLHFNEIPIKIVVDLILFIVNYFVQNVWVFKPDSKTSNKA